MRISERKRQLRDSAADPGMIEERAVKRVTAQSQAVARRSSAAKQADRSGRRPSSGTKQSVVQTPPRVRKQRGPTFYNVIGVIGLVFAVWLADITVNNYNSNTNAYPGKVKQYQTAQARYSIYEHELGVYQAAVVRHNAAVKQHAKQVPAVPKKPIAPAKPGSSPVKPVISASDFALPILYGLLSLAYLYLGYRARRMRPAGTARALPR